MIRLTGVFALAGLLLSQPNGATELCVHCQGNEILFMSRAFRPQPQSVNVGGKSGWKMPFTGSMPNLYALLVVGKLSNDKLINKAKVLSADSSAGYVFAAAGKESLISPYSSLPGFITYSADPIAAASAYQAPLVENQGISPAVSAVLLFTISMIQSTFFKWLFSLVTIGGISGFGYNRWQRAKRDAQLKALGLKRVRVRKKRRRKGKAPKKKSAAGKNSSEAPLV